VKLPYKHVMGAFLNFIVRDLLIICKFLPYFGECGEDVVVSGEVVSNL